MHSCPLSPGKLSLLITKSTFFAFLYVNIKTYFDIHRHTLYPLRLNYLYQHASITLKNEICMLKINAIMILG